MIGARMFAIAALLAGGSRVAAADGAEELVELRYSAPSECPSRDALIEQIRERTPAVRFAPRAPRVFSIRVAASEQGYTGTLVVDATADKQLAAARCDDLVAALALVTALAIDPTAAAAPVEPPPEPPPPPPVRTARAWRLDSSLTGLLGAGMTPDPLLAGAFATRLAWTRVAVELAVVAGRDTAHEDAATARFTRITARPAVCWLSYRRSFEASACGHVEVGAVRSTGDEIVNGRELTRLWLSGGGHGTVRWPAAASRGFAQLQLGLSVPVTRDRYRFMPGILLHETPFVTGWIGIGVGLRFL